MPKNPTPYLIAHTSASGHNAAQATIPATTEGRARKEFAERFPERVITTVAIREGRAPTRAERRWRSRPTVVKGNR